MSIKTKINLKSEKLENIKTNVLVLGMFEEESNEKKIPENISRIDKLLNNAISNLIKEKEFIGKFNQRALLHTENLQTGNKINAKRILLIGLGKENDFELDSIRQAIGKAAIFVRDSGFKEFSTILLGKEKTGISEATQALIEGILLSIYQFTDFKTQDLDEIKQIEEFSIIAEEEKENKDKSKISEIQKIIDKTRIICDAVYLARDLDNNPGCVATPTMLAEKAKEIAKDCKLKCKIFDKEEIKKIGMNAFLYVSKGSIEPPKFIILEYNGPNAKETICSVGKGLTFDSGGISIKPAQSMEEMKFDMAGGAAVLALMKAVAELKLPFNVIGLVPATENMPSGSAYKPGDIVKTLSGKTVEIINTDAEGRLILADALNYATRYKPDFIIDFATLTGACVVALGSVCTGLMGNDEKLIKKIINAGTDTNEKVWQLPLFKEYKDDIKSNVADLKNIGSSKGEAGAITAAMLLKEFIGDYKWAHLDIAGTGYTTKDKPYNPTGGTGVGVRLIIKLLENAKNK